MPRVLSTADARDTRIPFVELMNDIWRVLKDGCPFSGYMPVH